MRDIMRRTIFAITLILISLSGGIFSAEGQVTGDIVAITPDEGYEMTGFAKGKLLWPEGKRQTIELNLTKTLLPNNISRIFIDAIAFEMIAPISGVDTTIDAVTITPSIILSETNQTTYINETLFPPDLADNFYLNISLSIRTSSNILLRAHVIRFPDAGTILVDRDRLVPLVNLYGFPPSSFFVKFLPIYGLIILVMVIPGVIYSATALSKSIARQNSKIKTDGGENDD
jgi:hypothetical protein